MSTFSMQLLFVYFFHAAKICLFFQCCSTMSTFSMLLKYVYSFHAASLCLLFPRCSTMSTFSMLLLGAQWLSGRVLDSRPKGRGFEPHRRHCVVSLSKNINPSLVLVQPRKTRPFITERLLMGRKESNQTNKTKITTHST